MAHDDVSVRGHLGSRVRAASSWVVAGALTLVLSTTAVALMSHAPSSHAPLSEPVAAHSTPSTAPSGSPTTSAASTPPLAPPATVTYTYSGDDGSSSSYGSPASGAYGDD
ncbi:MAG: hypothetical protein KGJ39_03365 [Acidobacteriota bacterium]|nr:hypothetical protein [Acidobacteriota bacterium]